jgi:hypothetical protein
MHVPLLTAQSPPPMLPTSSLSDFQHTDTTPLYVLSNSRRDLSSEHMMITVRQASTQHLTLCWYVLARVASSDGEILLPSIAPYWSKITVGQVLELNKLLGGRSLASSMGLSHCSFVKLAYRNLFLIHKPDPMQVLYDVFTFTGEQTVRFRLAAQPGTSLTGTTVHNRDCQC